MADPLGPVCDHMLAFFSDETRWCRDAWCRDIAGNRVARRSPAAHARCLEEAMHEACDALALPFAARDGVWAAFDAHTTGFGFFNDAPGRSFAEVIALIRRVRER